MVHNHMHVAAIYRAAQQKELAAGTVAVESVHGRQKRHGWPVWHFTKLQSYVGYDVAKASLFWDPTQGANLTLTLADTAVKP
jgi:hypothetical protein